MQGDGSSGNYTCDILLNVILGNTDHAFTCAMEIVNV